jgi:hypothetical protein
VIWEVSVSVTNCWIRIDFFSMVMRLFLERGPRTIETGTGHGGTRMTVSPGPGGDRCAPNLKVVGLRLLVERWRRESRDHPTVPIERCVRASEEIDILAESNVIMRTQVW